MKRAEEGNIVLLFMDASHFILGCDYLGYIYSRVRRFVRTFSGRKRYNVLGAIDYVTKHILTVTNDSYITTIHNLRFQISEIQFLFSRTKSKIRYKLIFFSYVVDSGYITAAEVCDMLRKVASEYPGKTIHIILYNARYQKCAIVQTLAKELGIVLTYIPPYSPNLNLIERVWKFVKAELRSKYYDDFSAFQTKIDSIIGSTSKENLTKIKRLIGEKVQLFDDMKPITENTFECSAKRSIQVA